MAIMGTAGTCSHMPIKTLLLTALTILALHCCAEVVTLTVGGPNRTNDVFSISSMQVAELKSFIDDSSQCFIRIHDTNRAYEIVGFNISVTTKPIIFRGPATIELFRSPQVSSGTAFATFEVTPQPYSPDKSITIAPGAGGAVITLECSTDLVNWTATTNGVYTNLPAAKFFRIRAERVP